MRVVRDSTCGLSDCLIHNGGACFGKGVDRAVDGGRASISEVPYFAGGSDAEFDSPRKLLCERNLPG